jgi:hypothetical protein
MVEEITLDNWEQFEEMLSDARLSNIQSQQPSLLFRGQSNSKWHLHTTLERWLSLDKITSTRFLKMRFVDYYDLILSARAEIETFTGTSWTIPPQYRVIEKEMDHIPRNHDLVGSELPFGRTPAYEYMAYLRHHTFPSPLLDWTRSPYVAAYFAFARAIESESASIYMLSEGQFRERSSGSGTIYRLGPNVKVHRRHVLQQSEYTIALFADSNTEWWIIGHDDVFIDGKVGVVPWNFELKKFVIPSEERPKVLRLLDEHNLNAFSLFGSEESLMETIAIRKLDINIRR